MSDQIIRLLESEKCNSETGSCWGINGEHCDLLNRLIALIKGNK